MDKNNGTDIYGFDDNLEGGKNEWWWRIGDGRNSQRYQKIFIECMRMKVGIGGGDIKEGEYPLGGRGIFSGWREVMKMG